MTSHFEGWHTFWKNIIFLHRENLVKFHSNRTIRTGDKWRNKSCIDKPTYRKHMLNKSEIVFCSTFLLQNKLHNHHYIGEVSTCLIKLSFWQWLDMDKPMETRREFFKVSTIGENPELIKCLVVRFYIQVFLS